MHIKSEGVIEPKQIKNKWGEDGIYIIWFETTI